MNEYFFLSNKVKPGTAYAYTEGETPLSHELIPGLRKKTELPFELVLKKVVIDKGGLDVSGDISGLRYLWLDYQPNNLSWPFMSEKMKNIICDNLTGKENIVWMKGIIKSGNERRIYFVPRFQQVLDVLDEQKTVYVPGTSHIIKPVFSLTKVVNYNLFYAPRDFWEIPSGLYVSEIVKNMIQKEKLTGVDFEKTSVG